MNNKMENLKEQNFEDVPLEDDKTVHAEDGPVDKSVLVQQSTFSNHGSVGKKNLSNRQNLANGADLLGAFRQWCCIL